MWKKSNVAKSWECYIIKKFEIHNIQFFMYICKLGEMWAENKGKTIIMNRKKKWKKQFWISGDVYRVRECFISKTHPYPHKANETLWTIERLHRVVLTYQTHSFYLDPRKKLYRGKRLKRKEHISMVENWLRRKGK